MLFQKKIFLLFALPGIMAVCFAFTAITSNDIKKWVILKECTVKVNGSTNVNKFTCTVPRYPNSDTLTCFIKNSKNAAVSLSGRIALPVLSFDCVNPMMTKDLRKTLREKEYPVFYIHFISLARYPELTPENELIAGVVNIELAGVKKKLDVNFRISMDAHGIVHLVGAQNIHFSDFNLTPPRKLGGMIRADDKLDVEFNINLKIIDP